MAAGWEWVRLGCICDYGFCKNVPANRIDNDAWILDLEDIEKDTSKIIKFVRKREKRCISSKHFFYKGQVLYSKLRPYLNKVIVAPCDGYCTSEILPLSFFIAIEADYVRIFLMSDCFLSYVNSCSYGVKMPRLGTDDAQKALFALPPLAEQKHISIFVSSFFKHLDVIEESFR